MHAMTMDWDWSCEFGIRMVLGQPLIRWYNSMTTRLQNRNDKNPNLILSIRYPIQIFFPFWGVVTRNIYGRPSQRNNQVGYYITLNEFFCEGCLDRIKWAKIVFHFSQSEQCEWPLTIFHCWGLSKSHREARGPNPKLSKPMFSPLEDSVYFFKGRC